VTLSATDAENDPVTFTAAVAGFNPAFDLQRQYHFTGVGYFTTPDNVTAYVLTAPGSNLNGNSFYLLTANGNLYAFDGNGNYGHTTANAANLVATLPAAVFNTPSLLTNAQPAAVPAATAVVSGTTLTVNVAGVPVGTVFQVFVNASDGAKTTTSGFLVSVTP
jgi:hypothetical protein